MKIHIFGASGSGVTTLGQHLASHLQYPYFDNDDFIGRNQKFHSRSNACLMKEILF